MPPMDELDRFRAQMFDDEAALPASESRRTSSEDAPLPPPASFGDDFDEDDDPLLETFGTPEVHDDPAVGLPEPADEDEAFDEDLSELPAPPPPSALPEPVFEAPARAAAPAETATQTAGTAPIPTPAVVAPIPPEPVVEPAETPLEEPDELTAQIERYARRRRRIVQILVAAAAVGVLAFLVSIPGGDSSGRERAIAAAMPADQAALQDATAVLDRARDAALRQLGETGSFRGFEAAGIGVAADEYDIVLTVRQGAECYVTAILSGQEKPVTRAPSLDGCTPAGVAETQAALDERSERLERAEGADLDAVVQDAATLALQYARGVTPASFDGLPDPIDPLVEVLHAEADTALLRVRRDQRCLEILLHGDTTLPVTPSDCS